MRNVPGSEGLPSRGPEQLAFEKGREVAKLYEGVWDRLPPILRNNIVDSNVLLTVGELKPTTNLFVDFSRASDLEDLQTGVSTLNKFLEQQGVQVEFSVVGEPGPRLTRSGETVTAQALFITSVKGIERVSQNSKIPGVMPFDTSTGYEGALRWIGELRIALTEAQRTGKLPPSLDIDHIHSGIIHGYPDIAIIDLAQHLAENGSRPIVKMQVPHSGMYEEAEPNYLIFPEHAAHPTILENVRELSAALKSFYESEFHKKISQEPEIAARKVDSQESS